MRSCPLFSSLKRNRTVRYSNLAHASRIDWPLPIERADPGKRFDSAGAGAEAILEGDFLLLHLDPYNPSMAQSVMYNARMSD